MAESVGAEGADNVDAVTTPAFAAPQAQSGLRQPFLGPSSVDGADMKATTREEFIRTTLQPFFKQLSMYAYENTYSMEAPDIEACRRGLLEELMDEGTIV